jgi:hypothetical protein
VAGPEIVGQRLQGHLLVALELAHTEAEAGGDLALRDLLDVAVQEDAVGAPGLALWRQVIRWLEGVDGFQKEPAQCCRGIGALADAEELEQAAPSQLTWVIEVQERTVEVAYQR